jgi:NADPH:quinone reductase-like Zn-dependent oxidoreductase
MVLGALAEEIVLSESVLMPAPKALSWAECAAFPVGYLTAYHGLVSRGELKVLFSSKCNLVLT